MQQLWFAAVLGIVLFCAYRAGVRDAANMLGKRLNRTALARRKAKNEKKSVRESEGERIRRIEMENIENYRGFAPQKEVR